jgi:hypothetical protein
MRKSTKWWLAGASAGTAAALWATYGLTVRPLHLRWGATDEELVAAMPFDTLIPEANFFATRAVTIKAKPEDIWPFMTDTALLPRGTIIRHAEPNRVVVFAPPEVEAESTWVVTLEPRPDGTTRLVSRNRARFGRSLAAIWRYLIVDPGQFIIERNWMLQIRDRSEELAASVPGAIEAPKPIETEDPVPV